MGFPLNLIKYGVTAVAAGLVAISGPSFVKNAIRDTSRDIKSDLRKQEMKNKSSYKKLDDKYKN